jgi:hypothetical protein
VAGGWLKRLGARDFSTTTWDSDHSRLDGFWACLRDAQVGLGTALRDDRDTSQGLMSATLVRYVDDLAQLQPEVNNIERSRTTLVQRAFWGVSATIAALRMGPVEDHDDFWNEQSVGSTTR